MLQSFFTNTIESGFIKSLLYNANLPIIKTVTEDDYVIKGNIYIYKTNIIKCTRTGYLITSGSSMNYSICSSFSFGENVPTVTQKYVSKYNYYDSDTHKQLGRYLRCVRNILGINLMPYYNCFNYTILQDVKITESGVTIGSDAHYKVVAVPIKFNKKYSIAIDCASTVILKSVFYGNFGLIKTTNHEDKIYLTDILEEKPVIINHMNFKHPHLYSISNNFEYLPDGESLSKECENFESSLYLLIRLPVSNNSSIVVIEGDYSSNTTNVVNNTQVFNNASEIKPEDVDRLFKSNLSLLQINDSNTYAFSNRLIEYLLLNVIDSNDTIPNNIKYIKDCIYSNSNNTDIWDFALRLKLYDTYMNSNKQKLDISGFVDKDMERLVTYNYNNAMKTNSNWVRGE